MSDMKGIIDRFENEYAVIEIGQQTKEILKVELPPGVKVGDVVIFTEKGILIDYEATQQRKNKVQKLMDELWEE